VKTATSDSSPPGEYYCPACEKTYHVGERCPLDGTRLIRLKVAVDPFLGRELDGKYTILEKLGQGGMGAVYRGSQHSVGREVAIKVVSPHLVSDADVIKRFLREAKLASKLAHPNAVAVFDFNQTDDGIFYLVMELVTGRTLDEVTKAEGVFRPERLVRIATQVCDALEGAHALQIVHRDLKPANIMLLAQGRDHVKVLDFGLAKSVAPDQAVTTMTNAGALLGTPAFMPPELALGQSCDGRADLYSLGCVLYLVGSGRLPFTSESPHELIALHATETPPPMTNVPRQLAAVISRLLEKDPARRFQTAAQTREALEASLDSRITPLPWAPPPPPAWQTPSPSAAALEESDTVAATPSVALQRRRSTWLAVVAIASVLGIGIGVYLAASSGSPPTAPATEAPTVAPPITTPQPETPPPPPEPAHTTPAPPADPQPAVAPPIAQEPPKSPPSKRKPLHTGGGAKHDTIKRSPDPPRHDPEPPKHDPEPPKPPF
jgi:serine/threonine-protein kinase